MWNYSRMSSSQDEFDDEFVDLTVPVHTAKNNKYKRIGIEVDVTSIKGKKLWINHYKLISLCSDALQTNASSCLELKTGLLRDIKTKSDELRKETVTVDKHKLMLQNLIKLDRGELSPTDENFAAATEIAKTHGAKAMDHVTEEVETAQKRVDAARNAVIKMRSQLQAIATTSKSTTTTGADIYMKNNRYVRV